MRLGAVSIGMLLVCGPALQSFRAVNAADIQTTTQGGLASRKRAQRFGSRFQWNVQQSGGGNFLILRASGGDAYDPDIRPLSLQLSRNPF